MKAINSAGAAIGTAIVAVLASLVIGLSPGSIDAVWIDLPGALLAFVGVFGFLLVAHGWEIMIGGLSVAFRGVARTWDEVRLAKEVCEAGVQASVLFGVLNLLMRFITMLNHLWYPSYNVGQQMAEDAVGLLYAVILASVFQLAFFRITQICRQLQFESATSPEECPKSGQPSRTVLLFVPIVVLTAFFTFFVLASAF